MVHIQGPAAVLLTATANISAFPTTDRTNAFQMLSARPRLLASCRRSFASSVRAVAGDGFPQKQRKAARLRFSSQMLGTAERRMQGRLRSDQKIAAAASRQQITERNGGGGPQSHDALGVRRKKKKRKRERKKQRKKKKERLVYVCS